MFKHEPSPVVPQEQLAEIRQRERERVYQSYLRSFGLIEEDLAGTSILDAGAGSLAAFADRTRQLGIPCTVVSIDRGNFIDTEIPQGVNKKIGGIAFENMQLKDALGMEEEPQFDLILSRNSMPYALVNDGQDSEGRWTISGGKEAARAMMREKIKATIESTVAHLKAQGRGIFFPIFEAGRIYFPNAGGNRDFSEWRHILDEELERVVARSKKTLTASIENGPKENGHSYQRLILRRV